MSFFSKNKIDTNLSGAIESFIDLAFDYPLDTIINSVEHANSKLSTVDVRNIHEECPWYIISITMLYLVSEASSRKIKSLRSYQPNEAGYIIGVGYKKYLAIKLKQIGLVKEDDDSAADRLFERTVTYYLDDILSNAVRFDKILYEKTYSRFSQKIIQSSTSASDEDLEKSMITMDISHAICANVLISTKIMRIL